MYNLIFKYFKELLKVIIMKCNFIIHITSPKPPTKCLLAY